MKVALSPRSAGLPTIEQSLPFFFYEEAYDTARRPQLMQEVLTGNPDALPQIQQKFCQAIQKISQEVLKEDLAALPRITSPDLQVETEIGWASEPEVQPKTPSGILRISAKSPTKAG